MTTFNLSSDISVKVIDLCRENSIEFVCFPPNTTDKLQPLDVGLFGPMKQSWKRQLWKYKAEDPSAKLLQKTEFPRILKELCGELNSTEQLPRAFEKCGLYPVNLDKPKERIPSIASTQDIARHVDKELLKKLEIRRFGQKKKPRGIKVPAGQLYTMQSREDSSDQESYDENSNIDSDIEGAGPSKDPSDEMNSSKEDKSDTDELNSDA